MPKQILLPVAGDKVVLINEQEGIVSAEPSSHASEFNDEWWRVAVVVNQKVYVYDRVVKWSFARECWMEQYVQ